MRALFSLNRYFWKYRWRLLLGIVFIILTNIFGVYSPVLIGEGVNMLNDANEAYFQHIDEPEAYVGKDIALPARIMWISRNLAFDISSTQNLQTPEQISKAVIMLAIVLVVLYIIIYLIKGVFLFMTRQTIIVMSRLIEFDQKNEIYDHYQQLSMAFYKRNNTGDLMNHQ